MTPQTAGAENRTSRRAIGARVSSLFDEHAAMVLGLCRLLLRDHHEAEDACQQTFVSAYRALLRGTEPREVGPWLAAIARNECRARLRRRMRAPISLDGDIEIELSDSQDLAELADRRSELAALASEIARLPSRQREAIALRDFLGLSYEEVASTLSVSVPVVESLLFRARSRLRDTVRRVPRYAAGFILVPFAVRAAVARDVPEFDSRMPTAGLAAGAGAAAGAIAKLLSLPFGAKVAATTAALVAAGTVVAPTLIHDPTSTTPATPAAAGAWHATVRPGGSAGSHHASPAHAASHSSVATQVAPAPSRASSTGGSSGSATASGGGHPASAADPVRSSAVAPTEGGAPPPAACAPPDEAAPTTTDESGQAADASTAPSGCAGTPSGSDQTGTGSAPPGDTGTTTEPPAETTTTTTTAPPPPPPPPPTDTVPSTDPPPPPPPPPPSS